MNKKTIRIQKRNGEIRIFKCPHCDSDKINKHGLQYNGSNPQRYICKECGKTFNELIDTIHYRRRLDPKEIERMVYLYLTGYPISNMTPLFDCSESTIRDIIKACMDHFEKYEEYHMSYTDYQPQVIEFDEIYLNLQGHNEFYAWIAYDPKNKFVIGFVPGKRDEETLSKLFERVSEYKESIELILVDGYKGYERLIRKYLSCGSKKPSTGVINKSKYCKNDNGFVTYGLFGESGHRIEERIKEFGIGKKNKYCSN